MSMAVDALDQLETLIPAVQDLAVRHVAYGVRDEHYDKVGSALLWTLETGLGERFTPDHKAAWTEVYGALSGVMRTTGAKLPTTAVQ